MPTCSASSLRPSYLKTLVHDACIAAGRNKITVGVVLRAYRPRYLATAVAKTQTAEALPTGSRPTPLTVLHQTTNFLSRVLPSRTQSSALLETDTREFWEILLKVAQDDLSSSKPAHTSARIVVCGYGGHSGADDLVSALLEEPFASDAARQQIRERWNSRGQSNYLVVRYGSLTQEETEEFTVRSSWLQQFTVPVELHEFPPSNHSDRSSPAGLLFSADVPIIVCNPLTTPLSHLLSNPSIPWDHSNAVLVVTSSATALAPDLLKDIRKMMPPSLTVLFVDPPRALSALQMLNKDPNSATLVQRFQDEYAGSRISDVTAAISQRLAGLAAGSDNDAGVVSRSNAFELASGSIRACQRAIRVAEDETNRLRSGVLSLQNQMEEFKAKIGSDVFGSSDPSEVKQALVKAKGEVKVVMDRLTGWRLLWKVDDVADLVNSSVDQAWCRNLENKLTYHTGRLSITQGFLAGTASALLSNMPRSSFHSPVLQNTLAQLRSQPTYALNPGSLTQPIHNRRVQLTYPTSQLHQSAQRVVVGASGSVLGGIGIAWAGWAEKLGLLGMLSFGLEAETAAGLGMFSAVAGLWYSLGRWEKAKKRWWKDWDRVGEGLERDLRATLSRAVNKQVLIVPSTACDNMREMITKREDETAQLKDEMSILEQACNDR